MRREHVLENDVSTRNDSRPRDNASRIIVKREETAIVYDIIPHRLRKLLLAVNSSRFLRGPFTIDVPSYRLSYAWAVSSPRRVCADRKIRRVRPRDGNGDLCAPHRDKRISSGFVLQPKTATMRLGRAASLRFL